MGDSLQASRMVRGKGLYGAKAVGSFVPELTKKAFQKYGFSAATLLTDWSQVVGAEWASFTRPEKLKWPRRSDHDLADDGAVGGRAGATLVLRVEPARALDVQYQSKQIIQRINAYFGYGAVAEVRIVQGPLNVADVPRRPERQRRVAHVPCQAETEHASPLAAALARLESSIRGEAGRKAAS